MAGRIGRAFAKAASQGRGAFVAYLMAGYPSFEASAAALDEMVALGVDVIELGVPSDDPFADGAVIRAASLKAIEGGATMDGSLHFASRIRAKHPDFPIVLFSYFSSIRPLGFDAFAKAAASAGVDAVLPIGVPDGDAGRLFAALGENGLSRIPLVGPDVPVDGIPAMLDGVGDAFVYAITVKGVTGERNSFPEGLMDRLDAIRRISPIPVAAGFGISTRAQADLISEHADGFVVGSALVRRLGEEGGFSRGLLG